MHFCNESSSSLSLLSTCLMKLGHGSFFWGFFKNAISEGFESVVNEHLLKVKALLVFICKNSFFYVAVLGRNSPFELNRVGTRNHKTSHHRNQTINKQ